MVFLATQFSYRNGSQVWQEVLLYNNTTKFSFKINAINLNGIEAFQQTILNAQWSIALVWYLMTDSYPCMEQDPTNDKAEGLSQYNKFFFNISYLEGINACTFSNIT